MEKSYIRKKVNFENTYSNLINAFENHYPPESDFDMTGLIAYFQLCFEQSWKLMRELLIYLGINKEKINSPRNVLKNGFTNGIILNEDDWLNALKWRNDSTYQYDQNIAIELVDQIKTNFIPMFHELLKSTNDILN